MKLGYKILSFILLSGCTLPVLADNCASWINCNSPAPNPYGNYQTAAASTSAGQATYYDPVAEDWSYKNGVWSDGYAAQDPLNMPTQIKDTGKRVFVFSPKVRQWGAYDPSGNLVAYGRANGGSDYCADLNSPCHTPRGLYSIYYKGSADCVSKQFPVGVGGAKMPYCMFFNRGYSIHGSPYLSLHNGSHGCIRVTVQAAHWLFYNFISPGTRVLVLPYN